MKKLSALTVMILFVTVFFSCEMDKTTDFIKENINVDKETISGKWLVSENDGYISFEFNKSGNYIVVTNNTSKGNDILFGDYEMLDGKTVKLDNFGTIKISKIDDKNINFLLNSELSDSILNFITAIKAEEKESTPKTDLVCRTWRMVAVDGKSVIGTEDELTILFSEAGTYFITKLNSTEENNEILATWKWQNSNQNSMFYKIFENFDGKIDIDVTAERLILTETIGIVPIVHEFVPFVNANGGK